ncbi:hypothetical protein LPB140_01275 [Sphingorhabdus lutea]|uniref:GtrA/DPMS transmembrane domain-containing protein n=1 Tax=Sphingorhabdus lutea TaxID=1913578 RepID=A0A1L3J9A7_9SPHN|nr:GtrA family protein [Sphingorhabdus lutea]APG61691.1 hypothetical protein LPB140_01275 [Sphingorhabdus lutea]
MNFIKALWSRFTFTRYLAASVIALAFDTAVYSSLLMVADDPLILSILGIITPSLASAIGYIVGIIVHWIISTNIVFVGKVAEGSKMAVQGTLFLATALMGLAITVGIVSLFHGFGANPLLAKAVAVIASFIAVYYSRKLGVFK